MQAERSAYPDPRWYLARLKPGGFDRARLNLERQSIPTFMPLREVTDRVNHRLVLRRKPLFPGYLFLRLDRESDWRRVNSTYGVAGLVALGGNGPTAIAPGIMEDLFARTTPDGVFRPAAQFGVGDPVRLVSGPLAQCLGRIEALPEGERIYVLMEVMGQTVRAGVSREALQPI